MNFLDRLKDLDKKGTFKAFSAGEKAELPVKSIPQRLDDIDAKIKDIYECLIHMQKSHMDITRKECELMEKMLDLIENNPVLNKQNSK